MRKWRWRRDSIPLCVGLVALVGVMCACAGAAHAADAAPHSGPFETLLLEVYVNRQAMHPAAMFLLRADAKVLARAADVALWRLRSAGAAAETHQNEAYLLLDDLGVTYRIDNATGELWIDAKVDQLLPSTVEAGDPLAPLATIPAVGAFLNYDLSARYAQWLSTLGAQLDAGVFAYGWVGTTQLLNPDIGVRGSFVRLESSVTQDRPTQMASVRLGDATSRAGAWGRPLRFGGVQWSSNFTTRPDFITFPLPSVSGSAALPSTAQLFVNQVLSSQHDIESGPFTVRELPVFTGQGEIKMVVRDALGREQTIVQPFYAVPTLLRRGLDDFSYEFGARRQQFGSAGYDYGPWLLNATRRHGVTEELTLEGRAELAGGRQTAGLGATALWPELGVLDAAFAGSHGKSGAGALFSLGVSRQTKTLSVAMRTQMRSAHFEQLGVTALAPAPRRQSSLQAGWNDARFGTFGLGYVRIDNADQSSSAVLSASYSRNLGDGLYLSVSGNKSFGSSPGYALSAFLTRAFGKQTTASMSVTQSSKPFAAVVQMQQNSPAGPGNSYHLLAGTEGSEHLAATWNMQSDVGVYTLEAARLTGVNSYRAFASGGAVFLDGKGFLARRLDDSFAVVRVPGFAKVQVFAENQPIARTDASGAALLPRLRPYQHNRISIDQNDLPFDTKIDALEIDVVPYYRSGYTLTFGVSKANGATLHILDAQGKPMAAGAQAQITGQTEVYPVALDGEVYLLDLKAHNHVEVQWNKRRCEFDIDYAESTEPLRDLGQVACREMTP